MDKTSGTKKKKLTKKVHAGMQEKKLHEQCRIEARFAIAVKDLNN